MTEKTKIIFNINGMTCESCGTHVEKALETVDGVFEAKVSSWSAKQAEVTISEETNQQDLIIAVEKAGYQVTSKIPTLEKNILRANRSGENWDYDLIVIGSGGGGVAAAIKAAELGFKAAIIEGGKIGGTCVNIGCVPSKTLIRAADVYHQAKSNPFNGFEVNSGTLDWKAVIQQKDKLVSTLQKDKYIDVLDMYKDKITVIRKWAQLLPNNQVSLDDGRVIRAHKIIIATGAKPNLLPIPGIEQVEVLNSTTVMELNELPESLIVIGGRAVALELGQIFARFGTKVTILQRSERIVPDREPEISTELIDILRNEGMEIITNTTLLEIKEVGNQKVILANVNGKEQEFTAEQVLMAVGRTPNTNNLALQVLDIELDEQGYIKVDQQMQTSNPNYYAVGDVSNRPKYVYVAAAAGGIAAENALINGNRNLDLTAMPEVIFTDPQIASVGFTEAEAVSKGFDIKTSVVPMKYVPKALAGRDTRGVIKLIADVNTNRILGVHILAPDAGEMIQTGTLAIKFGLSVSDIKETLFPYLTNGEGIKLAALAFEKDIEMLSCCAG